MSCARLAVAAPPNVPAEQVADSLQHVRYQYRLLTIAVAVSFTACMRTPLLNSAVSGGAPSDLDGSVGGSGGDSAATTSEGTSISTAIVSFTASPMAVIVGESSTLSWVVTGAQALSIDAEIGSVLGTTSQVVTPTQTTTYTLTLNGSMSARVTVVVLQGVFASTDSMTVFTKIDHTATLLPNGKVLVAGGMGDSGYLASAQLYDPGLGAFAATGSMTAGRAVHAATLLPSGEVLIAGGLNMGAYLGSAELYDPSVGTFAVTGSMTVTRMDHTATLLPNGKVLIAGGTGNGGQYLASAELYDPSTGKFTAISGMTVARSSHTATLLPNGKVLIVAGYSNGSYLSSAELYDPGVGKFTATGSMTVARSHHTATMLQNGKALVVGGEHAAGGYVETLANAELYDPGVGTFTTTASMTVPRDFHTATMLLDGKVLVAGGTNVGGYLATAELFDPAAGTFVATGSMAVPREYYTATLLPNGNVLIVGGNFASAELYE
jgi:hypothetical protein